MIPIFDIPTIRRLLFMQKSRTRTNLASMRALSKSLASIPVLSQSEEAREYKFSYELYYDVEDVTADFSKAEHDYNYPFSFDSWLPEFIFFPLRLYVHSENAWGKSGKFEFLTNKMGPYDYMKGPDGGYMGPGDRDWET